MISAAERGPAKRTWASKESAVAAGAWEIVLVLAMAGYLLAATHQLQLPGVSYDEAADVVPAMDMVLHQPIEGAVTVQLWGHPWPLMIMPYIGPTTTYVMALAFLLAGVSVATVRLTTVIIGGLTLLLMWGTLKAMFDLRVASLAVLLLAIDPSYVFWSRMGAFVAQPMLPIYIGALWCLFACYRYGQSGHHARAGCCAIAAAFLMGFGLSTKLLFLWVWAALGAGWLFLSPWIGRGRGPEKWLWPFNGLGAGRLALAAGAALAGSGIVIGYNLQGAGTWHFFADHILSAPTGAAGLGLLNNIRQVGLSDLNSLLSGSWFVGLFGEPSTNSLAMPAFVVALAGIGVLALTRKLGYSPKRLALLLILLITFVLAGAASDISHGANHLILAWPIPEALVAVALVNTADVLRSCGTPLRRLGLIAVAVACVCLVGAQAWTTLSFHRALAQSGGEGPYSDAIYALADDLEQPGTPPALLFDWGFLRNLQLITANRARVSAAFTYASPPLPIFQEGLQQVMAHPDDLYVFNTPKFTAFPGHWEVFDRVAYRNHLMPVLWRTYRQRDGEPIYLVYKLSPAPQLAALPPNARSLDVELGDGLSLLGYSMADSSFKAGSTAQVTLFWRTNKTQEISYKVFANLLDASGKEFSKWDSMPVDWSYPTTRWRAGEVVADRLWLPLRPDTPPGAYHLFVGMYDEASGERAPLVRDGARLGGDTAEIAVVQVGK